MQSFSSFASVPQLFPKAAFSVTHTPTHTHAQARFIPHQVGTRARGSLPVRTQLLFGLSHSPAFLPRNFLVANAPTLGLVNVNHHSLASLHSLLGYLGETRGEPVRSK